METQKVPGLELISSELLPVERTDFDGAFKRDVTFHLQEEAMRIGEQINALAAEIEFDRVVSDIAELALKHEIIDQLTARLIGINTFILLNYDFAPQLPIAEAS